MYISPGVRVYDDGREVCDTIGKHRTDEGVEEYRARLRRMWERQHGVCCLHGYIPGCPGRLLWRESAFEHENGRGGGKRDDRIALPDGTWINGAAHWQCNSWKGSRRIDYNRSIQARMSGKA